MGACCPNRRDISHDNTHAGRRPLAGYDRPMASVVHRQSVSPKPAGPDSGESPHRKISTHALRGQRRPERSRIVPIPKVKRILRLSTPPLENPSRSRTGMRCLRIPGRYASMVHAATCRISTFMVSTSHRTLRDDVITMMTMPGESLNYVVDVPARSGAGPLLVPHPSAW